MSLSGMEDGEIEKPEQNGAVSIDVCPLAENLHEGFVLNSNL
jgi:hypothetical protein